jgi:hypothetical protein
VDIRLSMAGASFTPLSTSFILRLVVQRKVGLTSLALQKGAELMRRRIKVLLAVVAAVMTILVGNKPGKKVL